MTTKNCEHGNHPKFCGQCISSDEVQTLMDALKVLVGELEAQANSAHAQWAAGRRDEYYTRYEVYEEIADQLKRVVGETA